MAEECQVNYRPIQSTRGRLNQQLFSLLYKQEKEMVGGPFL